MKYKTERALTFDYPFDCQREMENLKTVLTENNIEFICYESNGYYPHRFVVRKSEKKWNDIYHIINSVKPSMYRSINTNFKIYNGQLEEVAYI